MSERKYTIQQIDVIRDFVKLRDKDMPICNDSNYQAASNYQIAERYAFEQAKAKVIEEQTRTLIEGGIEMGDILEWLKHQKVRVNYKLTMAKNKEREEENNMKKLTEMERALENES